MSRANSERLRWLEVSPLLDELLGCPDPDSRDARLAEVRADDPDLADEVHALLLAAVDVSGDLLDHPLSASLPDLIADIEGGRSAEPDDHLSRDLADGRTIDRYRLIEVLGRGGMGVVHLAERADDQFDKTVALKLMPRGLETPEKVRRFRAERQILARLEHPGIARLLDGGVTDEGAPYLVMERVDGERLDAYCDRRRLGIRDRLGLFIDICAAVQYAHGNLVIHGDLKPANILVTPDGRPKLLDFGIGTMLDESDEEAPPGRSHAVTPDYASPEQLAHRPVSTASDVYSLGVVLHRILTGITPKKQRRMAASRDSRTPGGASVGATPSRRAAATTGSGGIGLRVPADLDAITRKALEPQPDRRYVSASALADDVRRFLDRRPITARRATRRYRLGKFVDRHRAGTGVAAVVLILLVLGIDAVMWQARVAGHERDRARTEANRAERVADFVGRLFEASSPNSPGAGQGSLREVLVRGETLLRSELRSDPAVRGKLLEVLSNVYLAMGDTTQAIALAHESVADLRRAQPPDGPAIASALTTVAAIEIDYGTLDGVEATLHEAQDLYQMAGIDAGRGMARIYHLEGLLRSRTGDESAAAALHRKALQLWRECGAEADAAIELTYLAGRMDALGRSDEGLALKRQALEGLRSVFGPDHPAVLATSNNIAYSLHLRGRYREAEAVYREVVAGLEKVLGPDHPGVADPLNNLGKALMDQGRFDEAAEFVRRAAAIRGSTDDPNNTSRIATEMNLASLELALGRVDEAISLYRSGVARFESLAGPDSLPAVRCRSLLGIALDRAGQPAEAVRLLRPVIALQRKMDRRLDLADSLAGLGAALIDLDQPSQALPLLEEALEIRRVALSPDHWSVAELQIELGRTLAALGRRDEAVEHVAAGRSALEGLTGHDWALDRARSVAADD